jgi:hypothetical protein
LSEIVLVDVSIKASTFIDKNDFEGFFVKAWGLISSSNQEAHHFDALLD